MPSPDEDSLLTPEDVARFLQVPISWVYDRTRKNVRAKLPPYRIPHLMCGRYPRFEKGAIIALKEQLKRGYPRQGRLN